MSFSTALRPILVATVLLVLSGCFSLSRGAAPRQYYVLGSGGQPAPVLSGEAEGAVIGLRPPEVDEYLRTPFIVVRSGTNRVTFSDFDRWAEDLGRSIQRSLAGHLAAKAPSQRIEMAPWPANVQPEYLIQLHVRNFEGVAPSDPENLEGEAYLLVSWEILEAGDETVLLRGVTEAREPGWVVGDFDGLVSLLDDGLATIADDLVAGLDTLSLDTLPPNM